MSVTPRDIDTPKYGVLRDSQFVSVSDPAFCFESRQALSQVFGLNGAVYVFTADHFKAAGGIPCGHIGEIKVPPERSLDIDSIQDFCRVEALWRENRSITAQIG
jgi:N-acylneuraminate cytidylyltransferase